jgi:hypothetical protein
MGRRIGVARGSGTTTAYSYDGLSRLSSLSHSLSTTNPSGNQTYGLSYTPSSQINALGATNSAYLWAASYGVPTFDGAFDTLSPWTGSTGVWATNYGWGGNPDSVTARTLPLTGEVELYVDPALTGTGTMALGLNPYSLSGGILDLHAGALYAGLGRGSPADHVHGRHHGVALGAFRGPCRLDRRGQ